MFELDFLNRVDYPFQILSNYFQFLIHLSRKVLKECQGFICHLDEVDIEEVTPIYTDLIVYQIVS